MDDEIGRFKRDFEILLANLQNGVTLSLAEGLSDIREEIRDVSRNSGSIHVLNISKHS